VAVQAVGDFRRYNTRGLPVISYTQAAAACTRIRMSELPANQPDSARPRASTNQASSPVVVDAQCYRRANPASSLTSTTLPPQEALTATIGRGASWVMMGNAVAKFAALAAQVVLGSILTDVDFGVFATAASIGWFIAILKDAGTNSIVLHAGPKEYARISGAMFWMNMTLSAACALVISGIAGGMLLSSPEHPQEVWILFVIAAATPMQVVGGQLQTKLRQDLRFAIFSRILLTSAVLRQVSTVVLALLGFGAMSFAWPYIVCAIYEGIASFRAHREHLWKHPPAFRTWGGHFRQGSWTLLGTISNFALDQGPYLVMGLMLAKAITGTFYFAFQLTAQSGVILGFAVQQVLIPALVQLNNEAARQAEAALRALRVMTLVGSIACVGVSVCIAPLEAIVWRGKWDAAVPAIIILGFFFSWRINFGLTTALLHAQGRFKRHAVLTAFEGAGLMAATAVASSRVDASATSIAWWVGGWLLFGRLVVTLYVFKALRISVPRTLGAVVPGWTLAVATGGATLWLDHLLGLLPRLLTVSRDVLTRLGVADPSPWMVDIPAQSVRLVLLGSTCVLIFVAIGRVCLRDHFADALSMVPARIRGKAARLLALPPIAKPDNAAAG
jgi:O-antigen/teichoic acid export membrane protein